MKTCRLEYQIINSKCTNVYMRTYMCTYLTNHYLSQFIAFRRYRVCVRETTKFYYFSFSIFSVLFSLVLTRSNTKKDLFICDKNVLVLIYIKIM